MMVLKLILVAATALLLLPAAVLLVECLAGAVFWRRHRGEALSQAVKRVAVLIPAHNEETSIGATVSRVRAQLASSDEVVVVADNCTDRTAEIAAAAGARVLQRSSTDCGKGFALAFGVQNLSENPPDVLIVLDADTRMEDGSIQRLASEAMATGRPVQAIYLLLPGENATLKQRISALAFLTKSLGRAAGARLLNWPNQLFGTGMAFPWELIRTAPLASGNIVEDVKLGIDLAIQRHAPRWCPDARVIGDIVPTDVDVQGQRRRWEHGHLYTLVTEVPRLFWQALRHGRMDLAGLALDLAVPPLSLLVLILVLMQVVTVIFGLSAAQWTAAWLNGIAILAVMAGVLLTWTLHGRSIVPLRSLLGIPLYVAWKIPLYAAFLLKRQTKWNRSAR